MQVYSTKPITSEQAEIFLETLSRRSAEKFVEALRGVIERKEPFRDLARGKIFGIVPNDTENDGLGEIIYKAWLEIYLYRLPTTKEGGSVDDGSSREKFIGDLAGALLEAKLGPCFKDWCNIIADSENVSNTFCKKITHRSLDHTLLVHPTDDAHREFMERFRDKKV